MMRIFFRIAIFLLLVQSMNGQRVKVIAHRGASSLAPENTLASFKKAIELGVDYVELDVWNSYDDSLMVIHDNTLNRTTNGTGTVTALYYFQIRRWDAGSWFDPKFSDEKIPTLREVLTLLKEKNAKACIEIKNINVTKSIVNLIQEMGMIDNVIICCFYLDGLTEAKKINYKVSLLYYVDPVSKVKIDELKNIGGDVIGSGSENTQAMIDYTHQQGMRFWPWTIDDSLSMKSFITKKVDGIISNYCQVLLRIQDSSLMRVEYAKQSAPEKIAFSNYPNPFNPSTIINYQLSAASNVTLKVYDILGKEITTVVNKYQESGSHSIEYSPDKNNSSNILFGRLQFTDSYGRMQTNVIKMLMLK